MNLNTASELPPCCQSPSESSPEKRESCSVSRQQSGSGVEWRGMKAEGNWNRGKRPTCILVLKPQVDVVARCRLAVDVVDDVAWRVCSLV